jgi:hypothetical protein
VTAGSPKPIVFHMPNDVDLRAIGAVSVRHGQLDHELKMLIKSLTGIRPEQARRAMARTGSAELRKRARAIARRVFGDGKGLLTIESWLRECAIVTEERNDLIHALFGKDTDGEARIHHGRTDTWRAPPTCEELTALAARMERIVNEIRNSRLTGFIFEELMRVGVIPKPKPESKK